MNFVAEWTTTSAPYSNGRIRYGVAIVLSTMSGTPTSCATPATASMSRTLPAGLPMRLGEERLGVVARLRSPFVEVVLVLDELHLDAELRQRVVEQVVGAAVQARRGQHMVAGLGDVEQGERGRRLTGAHEQGADAALERGDALLDDVLSRVHDPRVDVAGLREAEQVCCVLGVPEDVRRRRVDRQRARPRGGVGHLPGVDLAGLEAPAAVGHGYSSARRSIRLRYSGELARLVGPVGQTSRQSVVSATTASRTGPARRRAPSPRPRRCRRRPGPDREPPAAGRLHREAARGPARSDPQHGDR